MNIQKLAFSFVLLGFGACVTPPDFPIEPTIKFERFSKNQMRQNEFATDSTYLVLSFTDGDGDLGDAQNKASIFLKDLRNNQNAERFAIPQVPEQGIGNGIKGEMRILLFTTCCETIPPCDNTDPNRVDTLRYEMYIEDRAGHKSNVIKTDPIYLLCK